MSRGFIYHLFAEYAINIDVSEVLTGKRGCSRQRTVERLADE